MEKQERTHEATEAGRDDQAQSMCVTSDFLAHLLHDLKTPVVSMGAWARRMRKGRLGPVTEEQEQALDIVIQSCERLEYDLMCILEYARYNKRGVGRLLLEICDLAAVLQSRIRSFGPSAQEKGISLSLDVPSAPVIVEADWRMLDRAVSNLIDNAMKYTDPGGWVRVSISTVGRSVEISISDSGKGIDKKKLDLIFTPFEQVMEIADREVRGAGLGLSNVRRYVKLHKGEIHVESEIGKGSTFVLRLPLRQSTVG